MTQTQLAPINKGCSRILTLLLYVIIKFAFSVLTSSIYFDPPIIRNNKIRIFCAYVTINFGNTVPVPL